MSKSRTEMAAKLWKTIQSNLEDRSVMDMGAYDDELTEEIKDEQLRAIDAALLEYANIASPYSVR